MKAVLWSLLLVFNSFCFAQDLKIDAVKKEDKLLSTKNIVPAVIITGVIGGLSTDAQVMGGFWVGASLLPLNYFLGKPTKSRALDAGFPLAWGLYNINVLDKDGYSHRERFKRNMAVLSGAILINSTTKWLLKKSKPDTQSQIDVTPSADGAVLSLSSRF